MRALRHCFAAAWLFAAAALSAPAQTTTWIGGGGNTNFSNTANWNNGIVNNGNAAVTFSGNASGAINVDTPFSVASMSLSGASSYSFSGSTLTIGSAGITDSASNVFTFNAPVVLAADGTFSNATGTSGLNFSNATAIDNGGHNLTLTASSTPTAITVVSGNITGSGSLTVGGTAFTILMGTANNFSGGTTINSGATLQVGDPGTGIGSLSGNVANSGTIFFKPINNPYTFSGAISGSGSMNTVGSTNVLTLSGANTYSGSTTINAGTASGVSTLADGAANSFSPNSGIFLTGNATSALNVNFNETIKGLGGVAQSTGATVTIAPSATLTISANNLTYDGTIASTGGANVTISGNNTVNQSLLGTGNYTGVTKITGGTTLVVANLANIGSNSSIGAGNATSAATNAASLVLDTNSGLSFFGATTPQSTDRLFTLGVNGGKIFATGTANITFSNTGAIAFSSGNAPENLTLGGTGSTTNTFAPALGDNGSGTSSLSKGGSNTWVLTGANTYSNATAISGGTLKLGADNTLPSYTFVIFSGTSNLEVSANQTINNFSGGGALGTITLDSNKALTVAPVTTGFTSTNYNGNITGPGALVVTGNGTFLTNGSKLKITGTNDYGGGTTIGAATVAVTGGGTMNTTGGTLEVTSGSTLGSGPVTVNTGGTLIGDQSSMTGALTVNSGGTFATVASFHTGSATLNGGATYFWGLVNAGTVGTPAAGDTDYGLLHISTSLALNAASNNKITLMLASLTIGGSNPTFGNAANFDPTQSYTWNLTTGASSLTGYNANEFTVDTSHFTNSFSGMFSVGNSGNDLVLNYAGAPIPEPATVAAICGLMALGVAAIRRRRGSGLASTSSNS